MIWGGPPSKLLQADQGTVKVKSELAGPTKKMIEAEPSFGCPTVAALLSMQRNTVKRIFQLKAGAGPYA